MNGCKHRINAKCTLFSNEWAESRCHIKSEMDCPYHDPVSITNADRIRAMTDEELADWFDERCDCAPPYGWLDWLKQEVE